MGYVLLRGASQSSRGKEFCENFGATNGRVWCLELKENTVYANDFLQPRLALKCANSRGYASTVLSGLLNGTCKRKKLVLEKAYLV
jgi:hypothetical protein